MRLLIKFPSRSRPAKMFNALNNIIENISAGSDYQIWLTLDTNDRQTNTPLVKSKLETYKNVIVDWGISKGKVNAINRGVPETNWDILLLFSDDFKIIHKDFDVKIREDFEVAKSFNVVMYYGDGFSKDIISIPVLGRDWYDDYKFIYHPAYTSLFCDNELYQVAERESKLFKSNNNLFRHEHPSNIGGPVDPQLRQTESFYYIDRKIFLDRQKKGFPKA